MNLLKKTNVKVPNNDVKGILSSIANNSLNKIQQCLGDFGIHVRKLVEHFNLSHPALHNVVSLINGGLVSDKMEESLSLYESASEHDCLKVLDLYKKSLNQLKIARDFDNLVNVSPPLRAISDPVLRTKLRKQGRFSKSAGSIHFSEFDVNVRRWSEFPNSFLSYVRLNESETVDLEFYREGVVKFSLVGMEHQADAYQAYIDSHTKKKEQYCGFHHIESENLIGILGKIHGFIKDPEFTDPRLSMDSNYDLVEFLVKSICLSPDVISESMRWIDEGSWFNQDPTTLMEAFVCSDIDDNWIDNTENIFRKFNIFKYRTRVYMVSNSFVQKLISPEMIAVMDQLERFHDYDYLPLFDYFIMVVPSISITDAFYNKANKGYFVNDGKTIRDFALKEDVSVFLDFLMIKNHKVSPILIGQKDDQQYFIGYC